MSNKEKLHECTVAAILIGAGISLMLFTSWIDEVNETIRTREEARIQHVRDQLHHRNPALYHKKP